jgi:hypothetical protein
MSKKNDKKPEITPAPIINSDVDEPPVDELIDDDDNFAAHLATRLWQSLAMMPHPTLTSARKF